VFDLVAKGDTFFDHRLEFLMGMPHSLGTTVASEIGFRATSSRFEVGNHSPQARCSHALYLAFLIAYTTSKNIELIDRMVS
jgi:hypothetical protein